MRRRTFLSALPAGTLAAGALASVRHLKASNVERERHQERTARLKRMLADEMLGKGLLKEALE